MHQTDLTVFAVGALIGCFVFFATLYVAKKERTYEGSIPLVTFGAMTAAIIAVFTIASGAVILIPTLFWSVGLIAHIDSLMYKVIWWALGHSSQQVNVAAHIAVWYAIAAILFGAKPLSEKVSRFAFFLYILFLQLASAHHLLVDPGLSSEYKIFNTSYALYLAVLASMIHGLTVPGAVEAAQRKKGFNKGLFEWLRKAPWGNPVFAGFALSVVMFGFLGGISGVVMGTEQLNIIVHNTTYVPGHFHGHLHPGGAAAPGEQRRVADEGDAGRGVGIVQGQQLGDDFRADAPGVAQQQPDPWWVAHRGCLTEGQTVSQKAPTAMASGAMRTRLAEWLSPTQTHPATSSSGSCRPCPNS